MANTQPACRWLLEQGVAAGLFASIASKGWVSHRCALVCSSEWNLGILQESLLYAKISSKFIYVLDVRENEFVH